MERLKTDTQETKKKVLGGNISGNLLNLVFREQSVPKQKQPNDLPLLQLWSNMWSKNFGISGGMKVVGKHAILPRKCKK